MGGGLRSGGTDLLATWLSQAQRIAVFTGAGISTECGIPDFRSPGGLWSQYRIVQFPEFLASEAARQEDWKRRFAMYDVFQTVQPGSVHTFCSALYAGGKLAAVLTQNIDPLHAAAGLPDNAIVKLHGDASTASCLDCKAQVELSTLSADWRHNHKAPRCSICRGAMKADVIMFGEPMPEEPMRRAVKVAETVDLFLVFGSSLQVYPAAHLPMIAANANARLAIGNRDPTPMDNAADLVLHSEVASVVRDLEAAM